VTRVDQSTGATGLAFFAVHQWLTKRLAEAMSDMGHGKMTPAHFTFLANLDCGDTHASAVAKRMGVTRQAVNRVVRELQDLGVIELEDDAEKRNQKVINFSTKGRALVRDARICLLRAEEDMRAQVGDTRFELLRQVLPILSQLGR
jgi:DNA-binding MarR family transcriptional regulator